MSEKSPERKSSDKKEHFSSWFEFDDEQVQKAEEAKPKGFFETLREFLRGDKDPEAIVEKKEAKDKKSQSRWRKFGRQIVSMFRPGSERTLGDEILGINAEEPETTMPTTESSAVAGEQIHEGVDNDLEQTRPAETDQKAVGTDLQHESHETEEHTIDSDHSSESSPQERADYTELVEEDDKKTAEEEAMSASSSGDNGGSDRSAGGGGFEFAPPMPSSPAPTVETRSYREPENKDRFWLGFISGGALFGYLGRRKRRRMEREARKEVKNRDKQIANLENTVNRLNYRHEKTPASSQPSGERQIYGRPSQEIFRPPVSSSQKLERQPQARPVASEHYQSERLQTSQQTESFSAYAATRFEQIKKQQKTAERQWLEKTPSEYRDQERIEPAVFERSAPAHNRPEIKPPREAILKSEKDTTEATLSSGISPEAKRDEREKSPEENIQTLSPEMTENRFQSPEIKNQDYRDIPLSQVPSEPSVKTTSDTRIDTIADMKSKLGLGAEGVNKRVDQARRQSAALMAAVVFALLTALILIIIL